MTRQMRLPRGDLDRRRRERFRLFNEQGGKFRVAVINTCNLNCFFCHNEAMELPREPGAGAGATQRKLPDVLPLSALREVIEAYIRLGGRQVNITGGEPLARPDLIEFLSGIDERQALLVLNTNAVLAHRLLDRPKVDAIHGILASLHTTDEAVFRRDLGGRSAREVMENIVALTRHGYRVEINTSLGPYNRDAYEAVLSFALEQGIPLKTIALVRPNDDPGFYGGDWVDPAWISHLLEARGGRLLETRSVLGGRTGTWEVGPGRTRVKIKNIAQGRLRTEFCRACPYDRRCGEGIYGLRVGVDGLWKPCLLRRERFTQVDPLRDYGDQILEQIDAMVGDWGKARFVTGAPD